MSTIDEATRRDAEAALTEAEEQKETASPEELADGGADVADALAAEEASDDLAERQDVAAVMKRTGKMTAGAALQIARRARKRAAVQTVKRQRVTVPGRSGGIVPPPIAGAPRNRPVNGRLEEARRDLRRKWSSRRGIDWYEQPNSFFFATAEIVFVTKGASTRAVLILENGAAQQAKAFHESIKAASTRLGRAHTVTAADTNVSYPGTNIYPDQDFLIEEVEIDYAGTRIQYADADIAAAVAAVPELSDIADFLRGDAPIYEDAGLFLPEALHHDQTNDPVLLEAVRRQGSLFFVYDQQELGASSNSSADLIASLEDVPDKKGRKMDLVSGGAFPVDRPYVWNLDPKESPHGTFRAEIRFGDDFYLPIECVDIGGGSPVKPQRVGVYLRVKIRGTSFINKKHVRGRA